MTLRIDVSRAGTPTRIRIAGALCLDEIPELDRAFDDARAPVVVDLSELTHVDDNAVHYLQSLERHGARLEGASAYLSHRLRTASAPSPTRPETE